MAAKYTLNPAAFRKNLLNAPWMVERMHAAGERIKEVAETIAPVYEEGPHPGRYRDAFSVESGTGGGVHHDRAYASVRNNSPEAVYVEFGTENNPAHHTLTIASEAV